MHYRKPISIKNCKKRLVKSMIFYFGYDENCSFNMFLYTEYLVDAITQLSHNNIVIP